MCRSVGGDPLWFTEAEIVTGCRWWFARISGLYAWVVLGVANSVVKLSSRVLLE